MQTISKPINHEESSYHDFNHDVSQTAWVGQEFADANFGDERLNQRLSALAEDFACQPGASIPKATGSWGQACAAYRFFDHEKVSMGKILESHQKSTVERMKGHPVILAVQDSTALNFSNHPETVGLGLIGDGVNQPMGLWLHSTMAFTPEGLPLGLMDVQSWARDPQEFGAREHRKSKPIEEKESYKWLKSFEAMRAVQQQLSGETVVVSVGDREADLYELFALASVQPKGPELLIRAQQNRRLENERKYLWDFLGSQKLGGTLTVEAPRKKGQKARKATLAIRFSEVRLRPPQSKEKTLTSLSLWAILAYEENPPVGAEPICWRLLTSLPVINIEAAIEKVRWYVVRWQIEIFHKVLKSGCRVEDRQLERVDRLQRVVAIDMIVAWRILYLTKLGRENSSNSAAEILAEHEWKALYCFVHKTTQLPDQPPSLQEAIGMIARLGGFLGRKRDGFPGNICLWRGLHRLHDISATWLLFNSTKDVRNG